MTFSYQDYKIKISKSVLDQIYQYRQTACLSSESGGVLIGRQIISTGNWIIDHCTVPMPLDVCKRTRYLRKDPKHIEFFTTLRQRENNIYAYVATVYKGNIIKNLIMDCQSYTKYRPNETTGGIFVSWRRKEELPTGA